MVVCLQALTEHLAERPQEARAVTVAPQLCSDTRLQVAVAVAAVKVGAVLEDLGASIRHTPGPPATTAAGVGVVVQVGLLGQPGHQCRRELALALAQALIKCFSQGKMVLLGLRIPKAKAEHLGQITSPAVQVEMVEMGKRALA